MFARIAPASAGRVLALVPGTRYAGTAAVDCTGLLPGSFATWNLEAPSSGRRHLVTDARARAICRRLVVAIERHRPSAVVLGRSCAEVPHALALTEAARRIANAHGVPTVTRTATEARALLLGRVRGQSLDAISAHLTRGFFPELGAVSAEGEARRYHRHSFTAAALAVLELVECAPLSAAVIAKDAAFAMGSFNAALMESARRHFPDNL